jgi:hypothetical protein
MDGQFSMSNTQIIRGKEMQMDYMFHQQDHNRGIKVKTSSKSIKEVQIDQ